MSVPLKSTGILGQQKYIHQEIIEASKRGDDKARYELYSLYSKAMFNISYRIMHNREEAEDMLQEAFTRAFKKLETFRYEASFGSWLKKIVVNTCLNALSRNKVELVYDDKIIQQDVSGDEEEEEIGFTTECIINAMNKLPDGARIIFSLYLLEGYDHCEISEILGISESTSKSQYMRAKRQLVEILKTQKSLS